MLGRRQRLQSLIRGFWPILFSRDHAHRMYRRHRPRPRPHRHRWPLPIQGLSLVASWSMERSKRLTYYRKPTKAVLGLAKVMILSAGGFNRSPPTRPSYKKKLTSSRCASTRKDEADGRSRKSSRETREAGGQLFARFELPDIIIVEATENRRSGT